MKGIRRVSLTLVLLALVATSVSAQSPQQFADDATRYMALGDSIAAGYKAMPVTEGYAYRLYAGGAFDRVPHTLFCNLGLPGATSSDVLAHQVPQALIPAELGGFDPKYITLSVGGNDLLAILHYAQTGQHTEEEVLAYASQVLAQFGQNLGAMLVALRTGLPGAKIFVGNQYPLNEIQRVLPYTNVVIAHFNAVVEEVVSLVAAGYGSVYRVDVHAAFLGRTNLVEGERGATSILEVHPTNAGHRVIEKAFADVIAVNR